MTSTLTKKINSKFLPTYTGGYPVYAWGGPMQYGFGSWLKENAGTVGTVAGAGIGTLIAPGIGTSMGAQLGGSMGGAVQSNDAQNKQMDIQQQQLEQQQKQQLISNLPAQHNYQPTFANGGILDSYAGGDMMNPLIKENGGQINDRLNEVKSDTTHEQSPTGGVPIKNNALLEDKEFIYTTKDGKKYVFSNRF